VIEIKLQGFKELDKLLMELPEKLQRKAVRQATLAGANIIKEDAKRRAPRSVAGHEGGKYPHKPGNLRKSMRTYKKRDKGGMITYQVGPSKKGFYGKFVEFGHLLKRNKKTIGNVPAYPFLRPAFDTNTDKVIETIKERLGTAINEIRAK